MATSVTADPSLTALTNLMPGYYMATVSDDTTGDSYSKRTLIYKGDGVLNIGQTDRTGQWINKVPTGAHLTVQAMTVAIYGAITIPRADVKIYCRTLIVNAGIPVTIDVSAESDDVADKSPLVPFPAQISGAPGKNGVDVAKKWASESANKITSDTEFGGPSAYPFGQNGESGGSITIICDELQLGDKLSLAANGRNGYTGCAGQAGGQSAAGVVGGQGGDGQQGGDGGDGGSVTLMYRTVSDATKIAKSSAAAGLPGIAGEPGHGGNPGGVPLGNNPPAALSGNDGDAQTNTFTDLGVLGGALDEVFLQKAVQSAKLFYLQNQPANFFSAAVATQAEQDALKALRDMLDWLNDCLGAYSNVSATASASDLRKGNLYHINSAYYIRASHDPAYTYFGDVGSAIPGWQVDNPGDSNILDVLKAKYLGGDYGYTALMAARAQYEAAFNKLASAVDKEQALADSISLLSGAEAGFKAQYEACIALMLPDPAGTDVVSQLTSASTALTTAIGNLKSSITAVQDAVANHFDCNIANVLSSLPQLAFVLDNPAGLAVMGSAMIGSTVLNGFSKITDNAGAQVDKSHILSDLSVLGSGDALKDGVQGLLFTKGSDGSYSISNSTKTVIASVEQLNKEVADVSNSIGDTKMTDALSNAISEFESAIIRKSQLQMTFLAYAAAATNAWLNYQEAHKQLEVANSKPDPLGPEMIGLISHLAMIYQEKIGTVVEFAANFKRHVAWLTLDSASIDTSHMATSLSAMWQSGSPPAANDLDQIESDMDALCQRMVDYFTKTTSAMTDLPMDPTTQRPQAFVVDITDPLLLQSFIQNKKLSVMVVPEGTADKLKSRIVSKKTGMICDSNGVPLLEASVSGYYWDVRVQSVQPRIYGAKQTTASASAYIGIAIKAPATRWIFDNSRTLAKSKDHYVFTHPSPRSATFIHAIGTTPDQQDQKDISPASNGGKLTDDYLNAIGLYGEWDIKLMDAGGSRDPNYQVDFTTITQISLYFVARARSTSAMLLRH